MSLFRLMQLLGCKITGVENGKATNYLVWKTTGRLHQLKQWKSEEEIERKQKADIDWIFAHGEEVLKGAHGATIAELAKGIGITNLWGIHGEGFVYYQNAMFVLEMAKPYLETNDKEGWLKHCEEMRATKTHNRQLTEK